MHNIQICNLFFAPDRSRPRLFFLRSTATSLSYLGAGLVMSSREVASNASPEIGNRNGVFREQSARTVVSTTIREVATANPDDTRLRLAHLEWANMGMAEVARLTVFKVESTPNG